ncbi:8873_t:CDS:2 [Cetraspora pellucida]|uniref:8873_t:CDS:1 n=1 Tax=Cetraspora pellucida TaxID=1433469 RepID=A0A9N9A481_9GLOM|nr:8873_t:CDS:2 [Cetraspora pellucida]
MFQLSASSAKKEETHKPDKGDTINIQTQKMCYKDDTNMQTQKLLPSAQKEKTYTFDNEIINKIMNILHENANNTIKEITNLLPPRNTELEEKTDEMRRKNKELEEIRRKNKELEETRRKNKELEETRRKNKELEEQIDEMQQAQKTIERLTREASRYQAELGRTINVRLSNDFNNSSQLREDIKALKKNLETFSVVKPAKDFHINKDKANRLLKLYKCTNIVDDGHYKSLLQATLQRFILESMIKEIDRYFSSADCSDFENKIVKNTEPLLNYMDGFVKSRIENDNITQKLPIMLRQQIYSLLGNRGFTSIVSSKGIIEHPFISYLQEKLIKTMNQFRIVRDSSKQKIFNDMATKLSRDIIRIFFFGLKAQEQVADLPVWFECDNRVNPDLMEGAFDPDDCQDEFVQICAFPLIGIDLKNDEKRKILSQANVLITRCTTN